MKKKLEPISKMRQRVHGGFAPFLGWVLGALHLL